MTQTYGDSLRAQGFIRPVVGVEVHNVGRGSATITEWSLVMQDGTALTPAGASIGPPLAHRMEGGGEPARWVVDAEMVVRAKHATATIRKVLAEQVSVRGRVKLGNGRTKETKETL
jgi:hypothetical protein